MPFPPPEDLLDLGMKPMSLMSPALAGGFFTTSAVGHTHMKKLFIIICSSNAPKSWQEKGTTEDEMAGWRYRLEFGHEFE